MDLDFFRLVSESDIGKVLFYELHNIGGYQRALGLETFERLMPWRRLIQSRVHIIIGDVPLLRWHPEQLL